MAYRLISLSTNLLEKTVHGSKLRFVIKLVTSGDLTA